MPFTDRPHKIQRGIIGKAIVVSLSQAHKPSKGLLAGQHRRDLFKEFKKRRQQKRGQMMTN